MPDGGRDGVRGWKHVARASFIMKCSCTGEVSNAHIWNIAYDITLSASQLYTGSSGRGMSTLDHNISLS